MTDPRKLGRNLGAYHGERIAIHAVLQDIVDGARRHGWVVDTITAGLSEPLFALRRAGTTAVRRIYLSAGIHGDEPAGPLALRQLLAEDAWPADASFWICPCLNPAGFAQNTRENPAGIDLNRDYRHLQSAEVRAHVAWLAQQPHFDLALCLHEDWEAHGFYVYDLNPRQGDELGTRITAAVAPHCPIDRSPEIDGRPARDGIILSVPDPAGRPQWPEAIYLFAHEASHVCTLEAPSDFPLATRVAALVAGVRAALRMQLNG